MAATFDSTFEKGSASTASPFSFVSNAGTVNGTVNANTGRILIGFAEIAETVTNVGTVTMTWDGVSMTPIASITMPGGTQGSVYMFALLNPNTGNKSLSVAYTGTGPYPIYLGAVSVYNAVNWQNAGTDTGTGTASSSTVTSANNNLVVVGHGNRNASSTVLDAGPTQAWVDTAFTNNAGMAYRASVSASTVASWTLGSSVQWANAKVDIIASGGYTSLEHGIRGLERGLATGSFQ